MTDIDKLFTHHAPTDHQLLRIKVIRSYGSCLASVVEAYVPAGADQSAAIRKIRECVMTANAGIVLEDDEAAFDGIQANAFTDFFKSFGGFFKGIFTSDQATKIEIGITSFISTDLGALAVDAVEYVQAEFPVLLPGASTDEVKANSLAKRDAAVAKLKADAATAGKDLSAFGQSTLIWFVETALQSVVAKGLTAAAAIAVHV